jgi:four helix bundle protein
VRIERFEDIRAWQEARALTNAVYEAVRQSPRFSSDYKLREQIQGAAVSVMSNIAEGFSRHTTREFVNFLFVAKGSAAEVESQLYVALDQGYVDKVRFDELYEAAEEVARLLSGFIHYLLKKDRAVPSSLSL